MKCATAPDRVSSHALNSDLDETPGVSGNSTPSDYSPHSQPFGQRPEHRTAAGVAARQTLSALPSPPPFTPAAGASSASPQMSAAASNNNMHQAWSPAAAAGDTPGVTSAWQPGTGSPASSSATFAFGTTKEAASPDAQPFGHGEQAAAARPGASSVPKAADIVRAAERKLSASHDTSDAMSDASGSVCSASTSTRSFNSGMPATSPGDILRAATSKLSAQHAISGSSRIQNPQRRKSGGLKAPMHQPAAPAPTPHSTPMGEAPEKRRSDDLAGQADTPTSRQPAAAASPAAALGGSGAKAAGSSQSSGALKVHLMGSPPAVSPTKSTKSPGSRSSVVSIGSICGAAGPGAAFTPQAAGQRGSQELEAGKYTPTMKLECLFDSTPAPTPAASVVGAQTPPSAMTGRPTPSISPMRSFDVGEMTTPEMSPSGTPVDPLPDNLTGIVDKLNFSGNKAVLRDAWEEADSPKDAARRQDQLQAALQQAGLENDAVAALGVTPAAFESSTAAAAGSWAAGVSWDKQSGRSWGRPLMLVLLSLCLLVGVFVGVQMLPVTVLPPGMACTSQNAAACRKVLEMQLKAAEQEPSKFQLFLLRMKWTSEDLMSVLWSRQLPEGVSYESIQQSWQKVLDPKQIQRLSHEQTIEVFGHLEEEVLLPHIRTKLAAAYAYKAQTDAERAAAERIAREKAEAERLAAEADKRAAEEARVAAERAEAERIALEKAEAERIAAQKAEAERRAAEEARLVAERAEAERIAREKAEAERIAAEQARAAAEKAQAERMAREKAEAERRAAEKAEAERHAAEEARLAAEATRLERERAEAERLEREKAEAELLAAQQAEAEQLAAERAAEEARHAAQAAEAQRLAAERAEQAQREAEERAAYERSEREAAAAAAGPGAAGAAWVPYTALCVLLLALSGGGGYLWYSKQQAARAAAQQAEIGTDFGTLDEGQAYPEDRVEMERDAGVQQAAAVPLEGEEEQQASAGLAAGAAAAVSAVGVAAAGALAAGVVEAAAFTGRVLTPRTKAPRPPAGPRRSTRAHPVVDEDEHAGDEAEGDYGAGSSRAAAAAASTPRRRGSRAAAEAGVESDGGASTGKARGARGRKAAAAAVPGLSLEPLLEDAPAEPADAAAEVEEAAAAAAGRKGSRRQSAPAATRRRNSTAAAAGGDAEEAAAITPARRSTRGAAARTPRV